jgi:hypothetical protein
MAIIDRAVVFVDCDVPIVGATPEIEKELKNTLH